MSKVSEMSESKADVKASTELREEHQVILRVLRVLDRRVTRLERGEGLELASLRQCVEFFRYFADACHHAKEEDLFFPVLESRGVPNENGPIGCMLHEHTQARGFTRDMVDALDAVEVDDSGAEGRFRTAARQYIALLNSHIDKEDNVLFNLGDQALTEQDQTALCSQFNEVACRSFGGKRREELEQLASDLQGRWPEA